MCARLREEFPDLNGDDVDIEADIADAMDGNHDGYDIARTLERRGWAIDAQLVAALDNNPTWEAEREAVNEWVTKEGITPSLAVGATVTFKDFEGSHVGEITAIDTSQATYTVFVEALGHVRHGCGTHGLIVPYEACEQPQAVGAVREETE